MPGTAAIQPINIQTTRALREYSDYEAFMADGQVEEEQL